MHSLKGMDQIVLDARSRYEDLTLFGVCVVVNDDVTELYGVVDSESDNDEIKREVELENYLTQIPMFLCSRWHVPNKRRENQIVKVSYHPSPAAAIRWPPLQIDGRLDSWILIQT